MVAQLATNEHLLLKHKLGKASSAHLTLPNDEYLSNENGREHGTISSSNGSATLVSGILFYTESWVPWSLRVGKCLFPFSRASSCQSYLSSSLSHLRDRSTLVPAGLFALAVC